MGPQPFDVVRKSFERCRAFVFPGVEDFGITPLEAQAAGKPVIAFRKGGVLETVIEGQTGLFFDEQTVESLTKAVAYFEKNPGRFKPEACRKQAENFSPEKFRSNIKTFLSRTYPALFANFKWGC
jgi:glycosyltransferase involved in cell wall biosynthesis